MDKMGQFAGVGSSSSSSRRMIIPEKEARKAKFLKKIMEGDEVTKSSSFQKRFPTLKTKASQLQTLCDVSVCVVSSGADGEVVCLWPEEPEKARAAIENYRRSERNQRKEMTVLEYLEERKRKAGKRNLARRLSDWIERLPLEGEALAKASGLLEAKIFELEEKIRNRGKAPLPETESQSGSELSDDEGEEQNEHQSPASVVDSNSLLGGTHYQQPAVAALTWNNGGLADPVQSYPEFFVGEQSLPTMNSGRIVIDYPVNEDSMVIDEAMPVFVGGQGTRFQGLAGGDRVFGGYPYVSALHEALPLGVWAPQFGGSTSQSGPFY